jgi:hypothetical protein
MIPIELKSPPHPPFLRNLKTLSEIPETVRGRQQSNTCTQELRLIKRLGRIFSELNLLRAPVEDLAPFDEESSSTRAASNDSELSMLGPRIRTGLRVSLRCELDELAGIMNDVESRRIALCTSIADVEHHLSESNGRRRRQLHDALMQLRSKQRLMNYEVESCRSMQRQLQLACQSRYSRAQKLYKDIKCIDKHSAQLISSRWAHSSATTSSVAANADINVSPENVLKSNESRPVEANKTQLTATIEQYLTAAIAATTPRSYRPNEPSELAHGSRPEQQ